MERFDDLEIEWDSKEYDNIVAQSGELAHRLNTSIVNHHSYDGLPEMAKEELLREGFTTARRLIIDNFRGKLPVERLQEATDKYMLDLAFVVDDFASGKRKARDIGDPFLPLPFNDP